MTQERTTPLPFLDSTEAAEYLGVDEEYFLAHMAHDLPPIEISDGETPMRQTRWRIEELSTFAAARRA